VKYKSAKKSAVTVAAGALGVCIWLGVWQWFTTTGPLAGIAGIPTMSAAVSEALRMVAEPSFLLAVWETVAMAFTGLVIALIIGISIGVITGLSRPANEALDPTIQFLRPLPAVVILPLALLIFGPTRELGVFLAAFGAIWPILVQTQVGVRDVDPVAIDVARSMTLTRMRIQTAIVLPSAAPYILTGVRIAASAALLLSIGAGLLGGAPGLGRRILIAQEASQPDLAFGLILWSGVLGLALALLLQVAERALVRGRRPMEEIS
jgi:ABC-type nitrate/sulfonate/bicarbonate transport system, permease component